MVYEGAASFMYSYVFVAVSNKYGVFVASHVLPKGSTHGSPESFPGGFFPFA